MGNCGPGLDTDLDKASIRIIGANLTNFDMAWKSHEMKIHQNTNVESVD